LQETPAGQWTADALETAEIYWESLGCLLWSMNICKSMPKPWAPFDRKETYSVTGIVPHRPASLAYWLRGFDDEHAGLDESKGVGGGDSASENRRSHSTRPLSSIQQAERVAGAWFWRSIVFSVQSMSAEERAQLIQSHPPLRSQIDQMGAAIPKASLAALQAGLLPFTVDDDFPIQQPSGDNPSTGAGIARPFRELTPLEVQSIRALNQGRLLALRWLRSERLDLDSWDLESCSGVQGLEAGVRAIWFHE
jgi:hypothetical protein